MIRVIFVVAAMFAACAPAAFADDLWNALQSCRSLGDSARLSCFDRALAARDAQPVAAKPEAPPAPVQAAQTKPPAAAPTAADFGSEFIEQKEKEAEAADRPDGPDEIHAKVIAIAFAANGRFTVTLDNGQVWRQVQGEGERTRVAKMSGTAVTIAHGFWKSYNLVFDEGGNLYKVVRDK